MTQKTEEQIREEAIILDVENYYRDGYHYCPNNCGNRWFNTVDDGDAFCSDKCRNEFNIKKTVIRKATLAERERIIREIEKLKANIAMENYFLIEINVLNRLIKKLKSEGTEKEVVSREALSVARGSSHEDVMEQGHSLRVGPHQSDTASSEMPEEEKCICNEGIHERNYIDCGCKCHKGELRE